jgi:ADP-ribosylglycohydrolase
MPPTSSDLRSRAHGAMLGLAVGDALGWPIEDRAGRVGGTAKLHPELRFSAWRRREGGRYSPHELNIRPGEYSDDTQLALAVARSCSIGPRWWEHLIQVELPLWTAYERGGGGALKRASQSWMNSRAPWEDKNEENVRKYLAAGGNGAVMRCLPHCLASHAQDHEELNQALDLDCITTHGHPRALLGSRLFTAAVAWALTREESLTYGGLVERLLDTTSHWTAPSTVRERLFAGQPHLMRGWDEEWVQAVEETIRLLHISSDGLSEGSLAIDRPVLEKLGAYGKHKGAGHVTAAAAIFLASRYASQPQQGLLAAAFAHGTDTDTLASLAASLLGALHGTAWLDPLAHEVQDANYILLVTDHLLNAEPASLPTEPWRRADRSKLYRWLESPTPDSLSLGPFGHVHVANITDYDTGSLFVRSWEIPTQIGQTLFVKRFERKSDGPSKWRPQAPPTPPAEQKTMPRAGLVLQVTDLANARRFYEEVVRLTVQRATDDYVSFGWLALEHSREGPPPQLEIRPQDTAQLIRVYVEKDALPQLRKEIGVLGLQTGDASPRFKGEAFRCRDNDGHTIEFVARNGKPPSI